MAGAAYAEIAGAAKVEIAGRIAGAEYARGAARDEYVEIAGAAE